MKNAVGFVGDVNPDLVMGGLPSMPLLDREISCESIELTIGSPAAIAACAYASLGGTTLFCGLAGNDFFGRFMVDGLKRFGIDTRFVTVDPEIATGITVNLVLNDTRSQITYPGSIAAFGPEHIAEDFLRSVRHLHVAGVYQQDSMIDHYSGLFRLARNLDLTVSLDCQWDATGQWLHLDEWMELVDILFANGEEACAMSGTASCAEAVERLAGRAASVVVKDGAAGAWVAGSERARRIPAPTVEVVDTIGAGDTFDAAYLFATVEENRSHIEAVEFANAAAARSCMFTGGTAAASSEQDVHDFMEVYR